jgi:hypothetical protein
MTGGITIRGNTVYQTLTQGATAPLNITFSGSASGTILVENNLFRSSNPSYVVLLYDGNVGLNVIFNNNRLWPKNPGTGCWNLQNHSGQSHFSGSGNVDHNTGAAVAVPN